MQNKRKFQQKTKYLSFVFIQEGYKIGFTNNLPKFAKDKQFLI